jgi:hypothetical protein
VYTSADFTSFKDISSSLEFESSSSFRIIYLVLKQDGMENAGNATMSLRIPRNCIKQPTEETNVFSLSLPENQTCPVEWVPLDPCRKYKIEIKSEYSNTWTRAPSIWETFTEERGNDVIISKLYTSVTLFNIHSILSIHPNESCTKST